MSECKCMNPPFEGDVFRWQEVGTDMTFARYGEVKLATCNTCGSLWVRYFIEDEAFSRSGRWFMGQISKETADTLTPENAVDIINSLEWHYCGGSYYSSAGFRSTHKPIKVDLFG
ncbi:MAG TPA: hypothetical protein PKO06_15075 [Candidatus Ozemobacteraceae bacterium]|nr:hypothetical protein [Candidatus Ozemobacteraceae bacterium]